MPMFGDLVKRINPFAEAPAAESTPASKLQLSVGPRFNPFWSHTFEQTRQPSPGAMSYAYTNLGLAEFTPIGGGTANRQAFRPLQPPTMFSTLALKIQGLGGLAQGQVIGQPLANPDNPPGWNEPVL